MSIRLRFISEYTLGSSIVQWWTGSEFSHVEVCLPNGYLSARPFEQVLHHQTIPAGVQIRPFDYNKPKKEAFATIDTHDYVDRLVLKVLNEQLGKPYDFAAIAAFPLDRDWRQPDHWICSELCAYAFEQAGRPLLNPAVQVSRLSPRDLALSPYVKFD